MKELSGRPDRERERGRGGGGDVIIHNIVYKLNGNCDFTMI